jgi:hypothetical protein
MASSQRDAMFTCTLRLQNAPVLFRKEYYRQIALHWFMTALMMSGAVMCRSIVRAARWPTF